VNEADICIQWKGTEVCGDFHCECGGYAHVCGATFMYQLKCHQCGVVWDVPDRLPLVRSTNQQDGPGIVETANFLRTT
jgi:hypothetical protein